MESLKKHWLNIVLIIIIIGLSYYSFTSYKKLNQPAKPVVPKKALSDDEKKVLQDQLTQAQAKLKAFMAKNTTLSPDDVSQYNNSAMIHYRGLVSTIENINNQLK